jgi:hypothetical protein
LKDIRDFAMTIAFPSKWPPSHQIASAI